MVMDPGHDAASFMQRAGRVARGDQPGEVIVRTNAQSVDRAPWLRTLMEELPDDGSSIEIGHFTKIVLTSDRKKFNCSGVDFSNDPPRTSRIHATNGGLVCRRLLGRAGESRSSAPGPAENLGEFLTAQSQVRIGAPQGNRRIGTRISRKMDEVLPARSAMFSNHPSEDQGSGCHRKLSFRAMEHVRIAH